MAKKSKKSAAKQNPRGFFRWANAKYRQATGSNCLIGVKLKHIANAVYPHESFGDLTAREFLIQKMKDERDQKLTTGHHCSPTSKPSDFYKKPEWRALRYKAFEKNGNACQCCGASPKTGAVLHVDHIKPKSIYPELAFDVDNLQILCEDCNLGKLNLYETDWR